MPDPKIDIEHVARLARLDLSEAEKERIRSQLDAILTYIDKLRQLKTEGVEPTSHAIPMVNVMREDEAKPSLSPDDALANAPDRETPYFRVPRIIED